MIRTPTGSRSGLRRIGTPLGHQEAAAHSLKGPSQLCPGQGDSGLVADCGRVAQTGRQLRCRCLGSQEGALSCVCVCVDWFGLELEVAAQGHGIR